MQEILNNTSKVNHKLLNVNKKKENFSFKLKITNNNLKHFSKDNLKNKITPKFYVIDATNAVTGRLAAFVASLLQGKNEGTFTPNACAENYVIIENCSLIKFSGKKMSNKIYYHHTGFSGGLKEEKAIEVLKKDCTRIIKNAVKCMLPRGPLFYQLLSQKVLVYASEHKHQAQCPIRINFQKLNKKNLVTK